MKKFKILSLLFGMALILTGCATVGNVVDNSGKSVYYEDVVYNQGQVVEIGDYIYYGNGYTSISQTGFSYKSAQKSGYLARINVSNDFKFNDSLSVEDIPNSSPKGVQKVNDKLIGYENQNMFVLGSYIYFTSANTHKNSKLENDYTQVSLFRIKFDGDSFKEIDTFEHDENSVITVQKGSDDNYYYIISEPDGNSAYNLYSIKIGDTLGSKKQLNKFEEDGKEIVDPVETVAVCDENSNLKNVLYTTASTNTGIDTDSVKSVDFATGEIQTLDNGVAGSSTKFVGREGDKVFYSYTYKGVSEIYFKDFALDDNFFSPTPSHKFYNASEIKNIDTVGQGYLFISSSSKSVMYKDLSSQEDAVLLLSSSDYSDILFTDGDYIYYSNSTSISRVNILSKEKETIVSMTDIVSGKCGYAGGYIYFYAKLEEKDENNTDENYYMYRVDREGNYQLVGKTI